MNITVSRTVGRREVGRSLSVSVAATGVRRSSFVVRRSSFVVRRSSFVVRRSSFVVVRCSSSLRCHIEAFATAFGSAETCLSHAQSGRFKKRERVRFGTVVWWRKVVLRGMRRTWMLGGKTRPRKVVGEKSWCSVGARAKDGSAGVIGAFQPRTDMVCVEAALEGTSVPIQTGSCSRRRLLLLLFLQTSLDF